MGGKCIGGYKAAPWARIVPPRFVTTNGEGPSLATIVVRRPFMYGLCICKPGSVPPTEMKGLRHLSRIRLATDLYRPTRRERTSRPLPCLAAALPGLFGLSARGVYQAALLAQGTGELLPHLFILACRQSRHGRFPFLRHFP